MSKENECPFCGSPLDSNAGSQCPSCGSALPMKSNSAPTLISQRPVFNTSAEAMDEVKRLAREGDTEAAEKVVSEAFGQNPEAARDAVEQTIIDMSHSGREVPPSEPEPTFVPSSEDVFEKPVFTEPEKPAKSRNWLVIGTVAAVIFLCLCCCLPIIGFMVYTANAQ